MTIRPAPKPAKREKAPRQYNSTLPRPKKLQSPSSVSKTERDEKRGSGRARPEPRRKPLARGKPPKKRRRSASEFKRIYGSKARVEWVKSLPCVCDTILCGTEANPIENAHVKNGGAGRKADAKWIVPMCRGHHRGYHTIGAEWFRKTHRLDLSAAAARTEQAWQSELTRRGA